MNRLVLILALLFAAGAARAADRPNAGVLLDSYAAIVNGKVITVGDVLAAMPAIHERLAAQYAGRELEEKLLEKFGAVRDALEAVYGANEYASKLRQIEQAPSTPHHSCHVVPE